MEHTKGRIVSSELGIFGKQAMLYGYLTVETEDLQRKKIKIDAYTSYETLDIGAFVEIKYAPLEGTRIFVAKKIVRVDPFESNSEEIPEVAA